MNTVISGVVYSFDGGVQIKHKSKEMARIGKDIKKALRKARVSTKRVSEETGLPKKAIKLFYKGYFLLSYNQISKIVKLAGIDMADIIVKPR